MKYTCVIYEDELLTYIDVFTHFSGFRVSELDEYAIRAGMKSTDTERDEWFDYSLSGDSAHMNMRIAYDPAGSCLLLCELECDESVVEQIRPIIEALEILNDRFIFLPTRFYQKDVCIESGRQVEVYRRKGGPGG